MIGGDTYGGDAAYRLRTTLTTLLTALAIAALVGMSGGVQA